MPNVMIPPKKVRIKLFYFVKSPRKPNALTLYIGFLANMASHLSKNYETLNYFELIYHIYLDIF
jgi:hypothetical protein